MVSSFGRWLQLLCGGLFTGENHGTVADPDEPSFQRRWQRTACVILLVSTSSRVDAENVDEDDRQTDDERQQRPEHAVHDGRLRHDVQYHVAWIARVGEADVLGAGVAILLGETLHGGHVVLGDSVALVK